MKMYSLRTFTLAGVVMAGAVSNVRATSLIYGDPNTGSQRLSLEGGMAFPTQANGFSSSEQIGPIEGLQYLYGATHHWSVGMDADYFHFGSKDQTITSFEGGQLDTQSTDNVATVEMVGRYLFLPEARFDPYLQLGAGGTYFHQTTQGTPINGSSWADTGTTETRTVQNATSYSFAASAALGVETYLTSRLILGLEAGWHIFGTSDAVYGTGDINVPTLLLRLGWRFGPLPEANSEIPPSTPPAGT